MGSPCNVTSSGGTSSTGATDSAARAWWLGQPATCNRRALHTPPRFAVSLTIVPLVTFLQPKEEEAVMAEKFDTVIVIRWIFTD